MPSVSEMREALGLPRNTKSRQVYHRALRTFVRDGAECLDRLEKMDYLRIQFPDNPQFAAEAGKLRQQRDAWIDDLREGLIPLRQL